ncbi:MAG TPA: hypothetical protein VM695_08745 [Phycisphaerae bacterium]|nr:hypothetical protein [Phycisphaerae bacterium]
MRATLGQPVASPRAATGLFGPAAEILSVLALLPLLVALACPLLATGADGGYAQWWGTSRGYLALGRTVRLAALAATFALVPAWILVAGAAHLPRRWRGAAAWLACLPMLVPSSLLATAWIVALGREGAVTRAVQAVVGDVGLSVYSLPAAAVVVALRYFGLAALVLTQARRQLEAGWPARRVFRLPHARAFVHLTLRPATRATAVAWLLVLLFAMNDHIIPGMFLISTYGTQVLIQYAALLDTSGAAALAAPMAVVGAAAVAVALWGGGRAWSGLDRPAAAHRPPGRLVPRVLGAAASVAVLAVALAVPVGVLAQRAGSWRALGEALAAARDQAWQTLLVSSAAGGLCMVVAAVLASRWVQAARRGARTAAPLVLLNLTVPPSLLAIGMIHLSQTPAGAAVRDTPWPLILGYVVRFLPVATLMLYALWRREPVEPVAAARVHGVSTWGTLRHVLWPKHRLTLLAAGLLAGLLAATELEMSVLLVPPGASTLGVRLYTLIHTAPEPVTSALALDILLLVGPAILLFGLLVSLGRRQTAEAR